MGVGRAWRALLTTLAFIAALIRLGPGAPGFVAGQATRAENWPHRARLLCGLPRRPRPSASGLIGLGP